MGTVYLAHEPAAERTVALKLLNSPGSPAAVERFLVEARALARLNHPHIIKVIVVELSWREPFLTMEYADGGSLADLCVPGALLPPSEATRFVLAAADAVAAAHAAGVIHRDLKPSNILLSLQSAVRSSQSDGDRLGTADWERGTPKVSDFGLAKRTDRDDGLTRTGPIGTPRYMSPEAAAGRFADVGPPADVYGLGATLYHLLTGHPPFGGEATDEVIDKVLHEEPARPRALRADLPAELEGIVVQAMAKDPARRYPTASALAADLRRFLAGQTPVAPVLSRRRRAGRWLVRQRVRIAAVIGVVLLAATLVAAGRYLRPPAPPTDPEEVIQAEIADGKKARLLAADGNPRFASWPLGQEESEPSAEGGGTFSFASRQNPRTLILLNDPGTDSYRFSADLYQQQKLGNVVVGGTSTNEVGLVLGYAGQTGADGSRVHALMALAFTDFDPADGPGVRSVPRLIDYALVSPPGVAPWNISTFRGVPGFDLPPPGPQSRRLSVDVTPAGVTVRGPNGQRQMADAADIASRRDQLAQTAGPVALPAWSPRMPLGIWCRGSWVAVRNVTIERLP
jgi:hypothetical protein